ncbi:GNAT family N-acetyltransferase [Clostridium polynesiense]|uniref:GNAT family N-acetyltransferase n=1 Tax=Clostridium polynesiense TaxID=1325933 RepID=UPI00058C055F|nr:GNAT family N-acetyltransferase [Clostridium polynesiense]
MIRKAIKEDIERIMIIVNAAVLKMNQQGNDQWGEDYPKEEDYLKDIEEDNLYVYCEDEEIQGVVCVNEDEAEEYGDIPWRRQGRALIIHRIAVNPESQGRGIAYKLLSFADDLAMDKGINYIKTDTYSLNKIAQNIFTRSGYIFRGIIHFQRRPEDFYRYDKEL